MKDWDDFYDSCLEYVEVTQAILDTPVLRILFWIEDTGPYYRNVSHIPSSHKRTFLQLEQYGSL